MNRIIKYIFLIFVGICYACNMSYACITPPVAGITPDFTYYDSGLNEWVSGVVGVQGLGEYTDFNGLALSYDPDNEGDMGGGNGISSWGWSFGESTSIAYEDFRWAGIFNVSLTVTDDDSPSATDTAYTKAYISRVDFVGIWDVDEEEFDSGTQYRPLNYAPSISLEAVSYPNTGYPEYNSFYPINEPIWTVNYPGTSTCSYQLNTGWCLGGGEQQQIILWAFSESGVYNIEAEAGTSSDDINIVVFEVGIPSITGYPSGYIAYGKSAPFSYDIRPDDDWEPDIVQIWIFDNSSYSMIYDNSSLSTAVVDEPYFVWNGKDYYGEYAEPGTYCVRIYIEKGDAYYYSDLYGFTIVDVNINNPANYKVGVGDNLALSCYPSGASGGSYNWSVTTGTATFSPDNSTSAYNTNFSSAEAGLYEVNVTYTKGEAEPNDTLVTPIKVVEVNEIDISVGYWDNVTDENITVLKGTNYDFRALPNPSGYGWPSNYPVWTYNGSPIGTAGDPNVNITFNSAGTFTLKAKSGSVDAGKNVSIKVIVPEPNQLSFVDNVAGEEHDIYGVTDPVWKRVADPNNPASYTQGKNTKINMNFWASDNLTYPTQVKVDGSGFTEDTSVSFQTWPSEITEHVSDSNIASTIGSDTFSITWTYKVTPVPDTSVTMSSTSGPHKIYRVFAENTCPDVNYTAINIKKAVEKVGSGKSTESEIATSANDNVDSHVFLDPGNNCICGNGFQVNFNAAMGTFPPPPRGMCCCRAEGLNCVLQVLGIGPYIHDYVNEHSEPNPQLVYYHDCPTCGVRVYRKYWDGFWNNWEGVVKKGNGLTCYAPANGAISIDEGTYTQIKNKIATDCGFHWQKGPLHSDICTHYGAP